MTTDPFTLLIRRLPKSILVYASLSVILFKASLSANTFTVSRTDDTGAGGSLRWAIEQANLNPGSTIILQDNLGTITLESMLPRITAGMTIQGGQGNTISGNNQHRIFFVDTLPEASISFVNLNLVNGYAKGGDGGNGGGGGGLGAGGAIFISAGAVTVNNVSFSANSAIGGRGGNGGTFSTSSMGSDGENHVSPYSGGGGGGLGGNGGSGMDGRSVGGGGGGFLGNGGDSNGGYGGGGGYSGNGGSGARFSSVSLGQLGGGGGGLGMDGEAPAVTGEFPDQGGIGRGGGGNGSSQSGDPRLGKAGEDGDVYGGGGGGQGGGGDGGRFGGGGGGSGEESRHMRGGGGDGGEYGGGGGNGQSFARGRAGNGGFGGGGGAGSRRALGGNGGFGGGGGGTTQHSAANGGLLGGAGAASGDERTVGAGGGGGAAGGSIFLQSPSTGSLTVINSSLNGGSAVGGSAGTPAANRKIDASNGLGVGTGIFLNGGMANFSVTSGTQTIHDTIADASFLGGEAGGILKSGLGTLELTGSNFYGGATRIEAGKISVNVLADGGEASAIGRSSADASNLQFDGGGLSYTGGSVSINRGFEVWSGGGEFEVVNASTDLALSGPSVGTGTLTKTGSGALSYHGNADLSDSGALNVKGGTFHLGEGASFIARTKGSVEGDGTLRINGSTFTSIEMTVGTEEGGNGTLFIENGGEVKGFNAILGGRNSTGSATVSGLNSRWDLVLSLTLGAGEEGTGSLTVTDSGHVHVDGLLLLGGDKGSSGHLTLSGSGTLAVSGIWHRDGSASITWDGGIVRGLFDNEDFMLGFNEGEVQITDNHAALDTNGFNITLSAPLSGNGALIKIGDGILTIAGNNTQKGGVHLFGGALSITNDGSFGAADSIVSLNGNTLILNGGSHSHTIDLGGTASVQVSSGTSGLSGTITSGTLKKTGAGSLAITGSDSESIHLSVDEGDLTLAGTSSTAPTVRSVSVGSGAGLRLGGTNGDQINDGGNVVINGTFDLNARSEGIKALTGSGSVTNGVASTESLLTLGHSHGNGTFSGTINDGLGIVAVTKVGAGTQILSGSLTYTGTTTVSSGTLRLEGKSLSPQFKIASTGSLELHVADGVREYSVGPNFSGNGTLVKTGEGIARWGSPAGTFALGEGSQIEVREGRLVGGSDGNKDWSQNKSSLYVASGAIFSGVEANICVDELEGFGRIESGFDGAGYSEFTFGVDDGLGDFGGVLADTSELHKGNYHKTGVGIQILSGANTYTGETRISKGTLEIRHASGLGSTTAGTSIADGATLMLTGVAVGEEALTLSGIGAADSGALIGNEVASHSGVIALNGEVAIGVIEGGALTLSGTISGGKLTKVGAGTLTLTGSSNTYSGSTRVQEGILNVGHRNAIGNGTIRVEGGALKLQSGVTLSNSIVLAGGAYIRDVSGDLAGAFTVSSDFVSGHETTASILGGTASGTKTLTTSFSKESEAVNDHLRFSDVFHLSGTGSDIFVLELSLSTGSEKMSLGWYDPERNQWILAVDGNLGNNAEASMLDFNGSFEAFQTQFGNDDLASYLGAYGYDTDTGSVWAVLNHNSDFAVVPEPSTFLILTFGASATYMAGRRKRRATRNHRTPPLI